jgi:hypothetical protein
LPPVLLDDLTTRPGLFCFNGAISSAEIGEWLSRTAYAVPDDLLEVWSCVGGGDLFESETLLEPRRTLADIDAENARLRGLGFPDDMMAFHVGMVVSAVEQPTGAIRALDRRQFVPKWTYADFDDWYRRLLRAEFGERYALDT